VKITLKVKAQFMLERQKLGRLENPQKAQLLFTKKFLILVIVLISIINRFHLSDHRSWPI